jgi:hypothetical protein
MMKDRRDVAQLVEQRSPKPRAAGSSPVIPAMNWAAVVAAILLVGGLVLGGFAYWLGNWDTFALAAMLEGAGIGWAILSTNDKD